VTVGEKTKESYREGQAWQLKTGNAIDYNNFNGFEKLVLTNFVSETGLLFKEDFIEASVEYDNDRMLMNDWAEAVTNTQSSRFTATKAPKNGIRFTNRTRDIYERHFVGTVDYSKWILYPNASHLNSAGYSNDKTQAIRTEGYVRATEEFTSGTLGWPIKRRVFTIQINKADHFEATITHSANIYTLDWDGLHHHKSYRKYWDQVDSVESKELQVSTVKQSATGRYITKITKDEERYDQSELSTYHDTFTNTPPETVGPAWGATEFGENNWYYHATKTDGGPLTGYEMSFGFDYSSLAFVNLPDPPTHWQYHYWIEYFPDEGSGSGSGNGSGSSSLLLQDDSYEPNSRQDGESDEDPLDQTVSDEVAQKFLLFALTYPEIFQKFLEEFGSDGVARLAKAFEWGYWVEFGRDAYYLDSWDIENGSTIVINADHSWWPFKHGTALDDAKGLDRALREGMLPRPEKFWRNEWVPLIRDYRMDGSSYAELTTTWNGLKLSEAWRNRANMTQELFSKLRVEMTRHALEHTAGLTLGTLLSMIRGVGKTVVSLSPQNIGFSQSTITNVRKHFKTGKILTFEDIVRSMKRNGWKDEPIDVVMMPDGVLTSMDNRRLLAARHAGINVQARVHSMADLLTLDEIKRFRKDGFPDPVTWGDAIRIRIMSQLDGWGGRFPNGSLYDPEIILN
jgi:hypothetical protein